MDFWLVQFSHDLGSVVNTFQQNLNTKEKIYLYFRTNLFIFLFLLFFVDFTDIKAQCLEAKYKLLHYLFTFLF